MVPIYDHDAQQVIKERLADDRLLVFRGLEIDHGLTDKELRFVESIGRWVIDNHKVLTEKQRAWLELILERYV